MFDRQKVNIHYIVWLSKIVVFYSSFKIKLRQVHSWSWSCSVLQEHISLPTQVLSWPHQWQWSSQFYAHPHSLRSIHQDDSAPYIDVPSYEKLIGRLFYLNTTRTDITFVVQQLSQFLSHRTQVHHQADFYVFCYFKCSPGRGLFFPRDPDLHIFGLQMLIGLAILILVDLPMVCASFLVILLSLGIQRSKIQYLVLLVKLNTELLLLQLVRSNDISILVSWPVCDLLPCFCALLWQPVFFHIAANHVFHEHSEHL